MSLLLGLVFGVGTNLLTADPDRWWTPLRAVNRYAAVWLPAGVVAVVVWEWGQRRRERRRVPWTRPDSPYPGLEAFAEDRTEVFFGREDEVRDAVRVLAAARTPAQRVLTVVGPSGCGKSSFVAAGVLPGLKRLRWAVLGPVRPGSGPFVALAQALTPRGPGQRGDAVARLAHRLRREAADGGDLTEVSAALRAAQGPSPRIVLAIDQFEDIVRLAPDTERELFLRTLRATVRAHPQLHVVLALPSGFLRDPVLEPHGDLLRTRFPLGTLTSRQIRQVITGPARAAGADIAEEVVDDLVVEATEGDALPQLGQLLRDLYEAAGADHVIGGELLARTGPLAQAIARYAEGAHGQLVIEHPAQRVEAVLLRFVAWDERGFLRQSVPRAALDASALAVVEDLRAARLVTDLDDGTAFDLVHEALLRYWPRLRELARRHQDRLRRITDLERRAAAWVANERSADDLLHGHRLAQARELLADGGASTALAELVAVSARRETQDARARADDLAERAQHAYALQGDRSLALALAAAAVREGTVTEKAVLTLWGVALDPVVETFGPGHLGQVIALGWDPDTGRLRTIGTEGDLCTWTAHGEPAGQRPLGLGALRRAGFSGGGGAYWVDTEDGVLAVRRFDDPDFSVTTQAADVFGDRALDLSFDGWRAVAQLVDHAVRIVDLSPAARGRPPEERRSFDAPRATALSWSPDGSLLALLTWRELQVLTAADGVPVWRLPRGEDELPGLTGWFAWSPDGRRVAHTAGRALRIRAAEDGAVLDEWDIGPEANGVFWSPDGQLVAAAVPDAGRNADAVITVWRVADHALVRRLRVPWGGEEIAWRADSTCFAWRSRFSGVWIGDHGSWRPRALPGGALRSVSGQAGQVAAVFHAGDAVHVTAPGARPRTIPADGDARPLSVAWQPGGDRLAVACSGGRVEIVDPASGRRTAVLRTAYGVVDRVAWSPDGSLLATVGHDFLTVAYGTEVWDPRGGRRLGRAEGAGRGTGVLAWSPDGRRLVTAEKEGPLVVLDARTGRRLLDVPVDSGTAVDACWSPDGGRLAFLDGGSAVRLCDAGDGRPLARSAAAYGTARVLRWSPDGRLLATAGDGWAAFWDADTAECRAVSALACRVPLEAHWSDDGCSFVVRGEDHRGYTWSLPGGTDVRQCDALLERSGVEVRELTAEECRRYGLPE
ncbi:nSTAND1 domain-containing NTPase [Streptomyces sp. NPDC001135]